VGLRERNGVAGFAGLQHCGSVWACPVCSAQILTVRALEIGCVLAPAVEEGFALAFGTLTMRHRRGQSLGALWEAAGAAWARATSGRSWRAAKSAGVEGWVRVWEVTDGRNGWHVHVHFVLVLDVVHGRDLLDGIGQAMFGRWSSALVAAGLEAPKLVGQEWHMVEGANAASDLAGYLSKLSDQSVDGRREAARSIGLELTHTRSGRARADLATRPVWSLLQDLEETGEADALDRWREWERGSKGRRQVGWSKGLKARFGLVSEQSDEEIAQREVGTVEDELLSITAAGWKALVRMPSQMPRVLEAAERAGARGAALVLDALGVGYFMREAEAA